MEKTAFLCHARMEVALPILHLSSRSAFETRFSRVHPQMERRQRLWNTSMRVRWSVHDSDPYKSVVRTTAL